MAWVMVMDDKTQARAREVRAHAEARENWRDLSGSDPKPPGDFEAHVLYVMPGYKVVYSVDLSEGQAVKHLSVGRFDPENHPMPIARSAMAMFADLFGFTDQAQMGITPGDPPWIVHAIEDFQAG